MLWQDCGSEPSSATERSEGGSPLPGRGWLLCRSGYLPWGVWLDRASTNRMYSLRSIPLRLAAASTKWIRFVGNLTAIR